MNYRQGPVAILYIHQESMDWPSMEEVQEDGMGQHPLLHMGQHQTQGGEAETRQMNTEDNLRY